MNRLEKKCLIASLTMHGALFIIMLVASAFTRKPVDQEVIPVTVLSSKIVDSILNGGGDPSPPPPAPAPQIATPVQQQQIAPPPPTPPEIKPVQPVKPKPTTPPEPEPEPPSKTKKNDELPVPIREDGFLKAGKKTDVTSTTDTKKPKFTPKMVTRKKSPDKTEAQHKQEEQEAAAEQVRQHQARVNTAFGKALGDISQGLSKGGLTMKDVPGFGTGGGGPGAANYSQVVLGIFDNAWHPPSDISEDASIVQVRVIVHRTGRIVEARLIRRSGSPMMDRSVQNALDAVKSLPPFPEGATDVERTFKIDFNLKIKRGYG